MNAATSGHLHIPSKKRFPIPASVIRFDEIQRECCASTKDRAIRSDAKVEKSEALRNKICLIAFIILIAAMFIGATLAINAKENARYEHAYALPTIEVTVHQGDTIDGIAAAHPVSGVSAHELGYVISDLNEDNPNCSTPLMPGDRLIVPLECEIE